MRKLSVTWFCQCLLHPPTVHGPSANSTHEQAASATTLPATRIQRGGDGEDHGEFRLLSPSQSLPYCISRLSGQSAAEYSHIAGSLQSPQAYFAVLSEVCTYRTDESTGRGRLLARTFHEGGPVSTCFIARLMGCNDIGLMVVDYTLSCSG